jgi:hypothetical protein
MGVRYHPCQSSQDCALGSIHATIYQFATHRQMRGFRSEGHAQRFLSVHGQVNNLFRIGRHLIRAHNYRELRSRAFGTWSQVTCAQ